jgi:hypothetical protein
MLSKCRSSTGQHLWGTYTLPRTRRRTDPSLTQHAARAGAAEQWRQQDTHKRLRRTRQVVATRLQLPPYTGFDTSGILSIILQYDDLNPTPYTLHLTPYTLHPTPNTLHLKT